MRSDEEGVRFRTEDEFISFTDRKVGRTADHSFLMRVWRQRTIGFRTSASSLHRHPPVQESEIGPNRPFSAPDLAKIWDALRSYIAKLRVSEPRIAVVERHNVPPNARFNVNIACRERATRKCQDPFAPPPYLRILCCHHTQPPGGGCPGTKVRTLTPQVHEKVAFDLPHSLSGKPTTLVKGGVGGGGEVSARDLIQSSAVGLAVQWAWVAARRIKLR